MGGGGREGLARAPTPPPPRGPQAIAWVGPLGHSHPPAAPRIPRPFCLTRFYTAVQHAKVTGTTLSYCVQHSPLLHCVPVCVETACQDPCFLRSLAAFVPEAPAPAPYPCARATGRALDSLPQACLPLEWRSEKLRAFLAVWPPALRSQLTDQQRRHFLKLLGECLGVMGREGPVKEVREEETVGNGSFAMGIGFV